MEGPGHDTAQLIGGGQWELCHGVVTPETARPGHPEGAPHSQAVWWEAVGMVVEKNKYFELRATNLVQFRWSNDPQGGLHPSPRHNDWGVVTAGRRKGMVSAVFCG